MSPVILRHGVASRAFAHGETSPAAAAPLAAALDPATIRRAGLMLDGIDWRNPVLTCARLTRRSGLGMTGWPRM